MSDVRAQARAILEERQRAQQLGDIVLGGMTAAVPAMGPMAVIAKGLQWLIRDEYEEQLKAAAAGERSTLPDPPPPESPNGYQCM